MKQKIFFIEEINQNELKNKKHKNDYRDLNYIGHLLILISTVTRCVSISAFFFFFSLIGIPIEIASSAIWLKFCVITARINNYKSIIKKKKKKQYIIYWLQYITTKPTKEAKAEIETHPVTVKIKISKCSI